MELAAEHLGGVLGRGRVDRQGGRAFEPRNDP